MFIFWEGKGLLVMVFVLLCMLPAIMLMEDTADANDQWKLGISFMVCGFLCVITEQNLKARDMDNQREPTKHSFYFIPLRIWGIIFLIGGIGIVISSFV